MNDGRGTMSFIDKAKDKIGKNFGEETVQIVNYDEEVDNTPKPPKPPKAPREKKSLNLKAPKLPKREKKVKEEDPEEEYENFLNDDTPSHSQYEEESIVTESAFEVEDDTFFEDAQKSYDEKMKSYENIPDLQVHESKIKDVLEFLDIPPTFEIEKNIFLPNDVDDIEFDLQAPFGFEQGQVKAFIEKTQISIKRYVELLKLRNEHIAKLATVIDRLQVDNNNLRYQNEISHGINIMPTNDSTDLENKYLELKLKAKRLEDELKSIKRGDNLSSGERAKFDNLQDEFSLLSREKHELEEENYILKTRLASIEEDFDLIQEAAVSQNVHDDASSTVEPQNNDNVGLPDFDPNEAFNTEYVKKSSSTSAFTLEDDYDIPSGIELIDDSMNTVDASSYLNEDDDPDDPLDTLMRDWNKT